MSCWSQAEHEGSNLADCSSSVEAEGFSCCFFVPVHSHKKVIKTNEYAHFTKKVGTTF